MTGSLCPSRDGLTTGTVPVTQSSSPTGKSDVVTTWEYSAASDHALAISYGVKGGNLYCKREGSRRDGSLSLNDRVTRAIMTAQAAAPSPPPPRPAAGAAVTAEEPSLTGPSGRCVLCRQKGKGLPLLLLPAAPPPAQR